MYKINSNPVKTILVIITGILIVYFFTELEILLKISFILGLIGVLSNRISKKIEFLWFGLAYVLGLIVPNIILAIIFYCFLFPIALLSRINSKDTLNLKNNSNTLYKDVNKTFSKDSFENIW